MSNATNGENIGVCIMIAECDSADEATYLQHRVHAIQHREMISIHARNRTYAHRANIMHTDDAYLTNYIRISNTAA